MKHGFPLRGYIEGYYGRAHTHEQRLFLFDYLKRIGMNAYMYAPKDDPLHRAQWRKPYPRKSLTLFRALVNKARRCGIEFIYAMSPGLSIRFSDPREFNLLLAKYRQMTAVGVKSFALLMDDIPAKLCAADRKAFGRPGAAQADLANRLFKRLEGCRLYFCPTEYCDDFARPDTAGSIYLRDSASLHPGIPAFWTGPRVISEKITGPLVREVAGAVNRPLVIWDNFHANDYTMNRVFLGPLTGRDTSLTRYASGYMTNMTEYLSLNLIPLKTAADYSRAPGRYRPEQSFRKAVMALEPGAAKILFLLRSFYNNPFRYGKAARAVLEQIKKGTLPVRRAERLMADLWQLTDRVRDRGLFNELYRFAAPLIKDFRLYVLHRKNSPGMDWYYGSQRNMSTVLVDRLLKRKVDL
jgi:protein O-GlcNAcase/histone acetyltransferase